MAFLVWHILAGMAMVSRSCCPGKGDGMEFLTGMYTNYNQGWKTSGLIMISGLKTSILSMNFT